MHLYNLTLQHSSGIVQAIVGNFSGQRPQEIVLCRGTRLELFQVNPQTSKLSLLHSSDVFASVRSILSFRLTGGNKDFIVVGSDSGNLVILDYDPQAMRFKKVHQETFGKSGVRRIVPGQFLAADPKGRSVMIAAIEKSKLVYVLNRDTAANLTISSPLEAQKSSTIVNDIVGVDVGFDNPVFAALEVDYSESDQDSSGEAARSSLKMLTYYELDLGLNHVVRKWSEPTDRRANLLIQVPGGQSSDRHDGPSGVLVCAEGHIIYNHMDAAQHRVPIPQPGNNSNTTGRALIIVSAVMHKMKDAFFFLLQSEYGDLYKITLEHEDGVVKALKIKYFDTIPTATSLCILKSGFLFAASEFGDKGFYQFLKLADDDDETEVTSTSYPQFGMSDPGTSLPSLYFTPHDLENLHLVDSLPSLDPIIDSKVLNFLPHASSPQIFAACGRGPGSSLRILRHGLPVEELLSSDVKFLPNGLWTTKKTDQDKYDAYIVLSFGNGTLVLANGDVLEEVEDSGFLRTAPSLAVQQMGTSSLVQVHPHGVRHILGTGAITEWSVPEGRTVVRAAANKRQVIIALSSAELVYFELDLGEQLHEYQDRKAMGSVVLALDIGEVPQGKQRRPYLAVGCEDQTVRILSLDPEHTLETVSLQALTALPSSICIVDEEVSQAVSSTFVNIGLQNGVLLRTVLDTTSGQLKDTRQRFLGTQPVRAVRLEIGNQSAVMALSSRSWLSYNHQNRPYCTPLIYPTLDYCCHFSSELCVDGFLAMSGSTLRIFRVEGLGSNLKQDIIELSHTPRQLAVHPANHLIYSAEADHRMTEQTRAETAEHVELTSAPAGSWVSSIRVINPVEGKTVSVTKLPSNNAAFSLAIVSFATASPDLYLVVGTAFDTHLLPRSCSMASLKTYKLDADGMLEFIHETEIDDVPLVLMAFQGRLMVGVGKSLRIYELGRKKLLRKAENKDFPSPITTLNSQGSRIIVGTLQDSIFFVEYKSTGDRLLIFADDPQARWITCASMLDYTTVVAGDRFGNVFVNRVDKAVSDQVDEDPSGAGIMQAKPQLMGASHKTALMAHFHISDILTSIHKVSLVTGGREVIFYTGLRGTIGVLVPLVTKDDVEFLRLLEQHLRSEKVGLVGRDQLAWRGYYTPVKSVIDGDLCESYDSLEGRRKESIASELDRSSGEIAKKLEQLRILASGF